MQINGDPSINSYLKVLAKQAIRLMTAGKNKEAQKLINKINAQTQKIIKTRKSFKKIKSRCAKIQESKNKADRYDMLMKRLKGSGARSVV